MTAEPGIARKVGLVVRRSSAVVTVLAVVGITAGVGALYRYSVGTHVSAWSLRPDALLSAAGLALVSVGFGAYVSASTHYTPCTERSLVRSWLWWRSTSLCTACSSEPS